MPNTAPTVLAVQRDSKHRFSKEAQPSITLLTGLGIEGDAHCGVTVKHRYHARRDPSQPNRRQVHLLQAELFDEVNAKGFDVKPGDIGENITTRGIDLLTLPEGTRLHIGDNAVVELTGLRHPCVYIDRFQTGLLAAVKEKRADGSVLRKAGVMSIVITGGTVRADDPIRIELPAEPHKPLQPI
jgi:MOSC domain-containing protein YiiM